MDGFCFEIFGLKVGVRVTSSEVLPLVPETFPPGWMPLESPDVDLLYSLIVGGRSPRPGVRTYHVLYSTQGRLARTTSLAEALAVMKKDMALTLGGVARRQLFVHAGAVGIDGRAVVFPGSSFSGKSTLVAALLARGATCLSDEYARIDRRGRVHPYHRPLSLRSPSGDESVERSPEEVGGRWAAGPLPLGLVVLTRHEAGAQFRPRELTRGRAALEVFSHTLTAVFWPRRALSWLVKLLADVRVVKGVRGEAGEVARTLIEQVKELR